LTEKPFFGKQTLHVPHITPTDNAIIHLLGYEKPLSWIKTDDGIEIALPENLQKPCDYAWCFEVKM
jgi:hypothetical protein